MKIYSLSSSNLQQTFDTILQEIELAVAMAAVQAHIQQKMDSVFKEADKMMEEAKQLMKINFDV